jgi:hypothetical protein
VTLVVSVVQNPVVRLTLWIERALIGHVGRAHRCKRRRHQQRADKRAGEGLRGHDIPPFMDRPDNVRHQHATPYWTCGCKPERFAALLVSVKSGGQRRRARFETKRPCCARVLCSSLAPLSADTRPERVSCQSGCADGPGAGHFGKRNGRRAPIVASQFNLTYARALRGGPNERAKSYHPGRATSCHAQLE